MILKPMASSGNPRVHKIIAMHGVGSEGGAQNTPESLSMVVSA